MTNECVQCGYFLLPIPIVANSLYFRKWGALRCPDFPLMPDGTSDKAGALSFILLSLMFLFVGVMATPSEHNRILYLVKSDYLRLNLR